VRIKRRNNWVGSLKKTACFIIGNGPSINDNDLSILDDYFTVGINRIILKYNPTILVWQDLHIWDIHRQIISSPCILHAREGSYRNTGQNRIMYNWRLIGEQYEQCKYCTNSYAGRGSTSLIAYKLAWALGCDPIILVGIDCCYRNGQTDFYGNNPDHKSTTLKYCNDALKIIKYTSRKIISCSDNKVFPKRDLKSVCEELKEHKSKNIREVIKRLG